MALKVLGIHATGFGDALLYSGLVECFARAGYVVRLNTVSVARNPEVMELVWKRNPFLEPEPVDHPAHIGACMLPEFSDHSDKTMFSIPRMEYVHGFKIPLHQVPQIYYVPAYRPEFAERVLCDPTSISQGFPNEDIAAFVNYYGKLNDYDPRRVIVLKSPAQGISGQTALPENDRYGLRDLFELCDLLFSCRLFLCVDSGNQSLASAIHGRYGNPKTICLTTTMAFVDRLFIHPNVHYSPIGNLTPNYKLTRP